MIAGVSIAAEVVDRTEITGWTQGVDARSRVRARAASEHAARLASVGCRRTCGTGCERRGRGTSSQEGTKQERAIWHLVDVVRAGLMDAHVTHVTHGNRGIPRDLL